MLVILGDLEFLIVEMLTQIRSNQIQIRLDETPLYLDSFKIDKGIDGYGCGPIVRFVCISTKLCPDDPVSIIKRARRFDSHLQEVVRTVNQV